MYGNVYELMQDYYDKDYYQKKIKIDPVNRDQFNDNVAFFHRVLRGGNYQEKYRGILCTAEDLSSTARKYTFDAIDYSFGLRLVRER
jgi:formylglycine-generating enzyme required for sulfatase activity